MATVTKYICDIKNCDNEAKYKQKPIQVIFTTEQTEGRSCKPYLEIEKMDICDTCMDKLLNGKTIKAQGAQGYNNYIL